jgi:uncharacterized protein DUF6713
MSDLLFWLYLTNAAILICHEIDSAYWREWELFNLPGGAGFFVLLHLPLMFVVLYGLVLVREGATAGLVISTLLAASGIFAFTAHMFFIARGHHQFQTPISLFILLATLLMSLAQAIVTVMMLAGVAAVF